MTKKGLIALELISKYLRRNSREDDIFDLAVKHFDKRIGFAMNKLEKGWFYQAQLL